MNNPPNDEINPKLTEAAQAWLDEHLKQIKDRIIQEASARAKKDDSAQLGIEPMMISDAAKIYAPGQRISVSVMHQIVVRLLAVFQRLFEPISGLTIICASLAVVFGWLGIYGNATSNYAAGWLDIAKIFAGAVVGSAGAGVISGSRDQ